MTGIDGSPPDLRHTPAGCSFHPRCAWAVPECRSQEPPLVQLTERAGARSALCWLQDGRHEVPAELALGLSDVQTDGTRAAGPTGAARTEEGR